MTNASIILNESIRLMNEGVLTGTGRFVEVENDDGTTERLELPEEIHTFNAWKQRGYCRLKLSHFFTAAQVQPLTTRA